MNFCHLFMYLNSCNPPPPPTISRVLCSFERNALKSLSSNTKVWLAENAFSSSGVGLAKHYFSSLLHYEWLRFRVLVNTAELVVFPFTIRSITAWLINYIYSSVIYWNLNVTGTLRKYFQCLLFWRSCYSLSGFGDRNLVRYRIKSRGFGVGSPLKIPPFSLSTVIVQSGRICRLPSLSFLISSDMFTGAPGWLSWRTVRPLILGFWVQALCWA